MKATDSAFMLIELLRDINNYRQRFILAEGAKYFSSTYSDISNQYKSLISQTNKYSDLFLIRLQCELHDDKQYQQIISLIADEIESFELWYLENRALVDSLFATEAIQSVIEDEADFKYGKQFAKAKEEFKEADADERVWHSLARAYGARCHGDYDERSFTHEDWDYIENSLEEYKKHFKVYQVDLPSMYDGYKSKMKPRWKECYNNLQNMIKQYGEYKNQLSHNYIIDVYSKIFYFLAPLSGLIMNGNPIENNKAKGPDNKKKERYARYNSLKECVPRDDIRERIDDLVNYYFDKHGAIDGIFGYNLFLCLKGNGWINERGCSQEHFGELLLRDYQTKCSFKNGGAISDGKGKKDMTFEKKLHEILPIK